jgi:nucleoid-associated protein YgaU
MAWPTPNHYNEAIQNPRLNFEDAELKAGQVESNKFGLPCPRSGNFATVYRMECGQQNWAIRCFTRNVTDQERRYLAIDEYLARIKLPYTLGFEYLSKGILVNGQWYPVLKMAWCEGKLIDQFIKKHLDDSAVLQNLATRWVKMIHALEQAKIAHGDLQHGNILIVNNDFKLVDYDGMFVPSLVGQGSHEQGHPNYQHPNRTGRDFSEDIDYFSAWVIYIALVSFSIDQNLWYDVGHKKDKDARDEFLLLKKADFENPNTSSTLRLLSQHNDDRIRSLADKFKQFCYLKLSDIPPLDDKIVFTSQNPDSNPQWLTDYFIQQSQSTSGANQETVTNTTSTSSDRLADYSPQHTVQPTFSPPYQTTSVPSARKQKFPYRSRKRTTQRGLFDNINGFGRDDPEPKLEIVWKLPRGNTNYSNSTTRQNNLWAIIISILLLVFISQFFNSDESCTTSSPNEYCVKSGDTLSKIAKKFYGSGIKECWVLIKKANQGINERDIKIDSKLKIPEKPTGKCQIKEPFVLTSQSNSHFSTKYRVKRGDTLAKIAKIYYGKTSCWKLIKKANPSINENRLRIGTQLKIPNKSKGNCQVNEHFSLDSQKVTSSPKFPNPELTVENYYSAINNHQYKVAWRQLSTHFKRKFNRDGFNGNYKRWWAGKVKRVKIKEIKLIKQRSNKATVFVQLSYQLQNGKNAVDKSPYIQLTFDKKKQAWLFYDKRKNP